MAKTVNHKSDEPHFGDDPLLEIAPRTSFSAMIFELLSEKAPNPSELKLFETILNISIDHGPDTPSAVKVVESAKEGKEIGEAVAEGFKQINDIHGGAIEPAMELFYKIKKENLKIEKLVTTAIREGKRLPGFGHRIYTKDPRTDLLFKLAREEGINSEYIEIAEEIATELNKQKGKPLPCNIDGSIAAILCSFGWNPNLGKAVFISARAPGLCGQFLNNS